MMSLLRTQLPSHSAVRSKLGISDTPSALEDPTLSHLLSSRRDTDFGCEPAVLDALYGLILVRRPITVLEIGTYRGLSARVMSAALQRNGQGRLYTVDDGRQCKDDQSFAELLASCIEDSWVVTIRKSSVDAFVDWGRARIDLLFLDGSHDFLSSCIDFSLWSRFVSPDGLIVVHDTHTRMERRFPEDYIHPIDFYKVLNIARVEECFLGHEWEGCAFITHNRDDHDGQ